MTDSGKRPLGPAEPPRDELPVPLPQLTGRKPLNHDDSAPLSSEETGTAPDGPRQMPVPVWAQGTFRALLFRIGRYRFAVPLVLLRGITEAPRSLHRLPGQPAWHRGLFDYRGLTVVVADAGLLLGFGGSGADPAYLMVIGDGREAFGCDVIDDTLTVEPESVRWRLQRCEGEWLPGYLAGEMAGLMDAGAVRNRFRHE